MLITILLVVILAQAALLLYLLDALTSLRRRIRRHLHLWATWRNSDNRRRIRRLTEELRANRLEQRAKHARVDRILRTRRNGGRACPGGDT